MPTSVWTGGWLIRLKRTACLPLDVSVAISPAEEPLASGKLLTSQVGGPKGSSKVPLSMRLSAAEAGGVGGWPAATDVLSPSATRTWPPMASTKRLAQASRNLSLFAADLHSIASRR